MLGRRSVDMQSRLGADGMFVFAVRGTGSASPLWSLVIRESESVTDPTLLDPAILGPLYVGTGTVLADPYSSMERNVVRIRVEVEALAFRAKCSGCLRGLVKRAPIPAARRLRGLRLES